jgi:hypothetical protein
MKTASIITDACRFHLVAAWIRKAEKAPIRDRLSAFHLNYANEFKCCRPYTVRK